MSSAINRISEKAVAEVVDELLKQSVKQQVLYVDTETSGLDPKSEKLLLVQMRLNRGAILVFEYKHMTPYLDSFKELFLRNELVMHNAKFDLQFLAVNFGLELDDPRLKVYDTQVAEAVLCAGVKTNLKRYTKLESTVKRRCGVDLDKTTRVSFIGNDGANLTDKQIKYAAEDVEYMSDIRSQQIAEAKELGMTDTFRLEFDLVKVVAQMELTGVRFDRRKWREQLKQLDKDLQESIQNVYEEAAPYLTQTSLFDELPFNLNSQAEVLSFIKNNIGLDIPDTKELTLSQNPHSFCLALLEYRELEKLKSSFGETLLKKVNPKTKRIHPSFNQCFTSTGRFSSDNPNVQQIPSMGKGAALRTCFRAEVGNKLVCADYSQIELRILAQLSQEPALLESYNSGEDIHAKTASLAFGLEIGNITDSQRKIAKILNFASVYGGGPTAISKGLLKTIDNKQIITRDQAKAILEESFGVKAGREDPHYALARELVNAYFKNLPQAKEFLDKSGHDAVICRYSVTMLGRKRFYPEIEEFNFENTSTDDWKKLVSSVERRGKNHPIQGCSADITKLAMVLMSKEFYKLRKETGIDARLILQVHDEVVVECPESAIEVVKEIEERTMIAAGKRFLTDVPVEVSAGVGDYWTKS